MKQLIKLFNEIFFKFPVIFIFLFLSIFLQTFLNSLTVVAMTPLVDYLLETQNQSLSFITIYFENFLNLTENNKFNLIFIMVFVSIVFFLAAIAGIVTMSAIAIVEHKLKNYILLDTLEVFINTKHSFILENKVGKIANSFYVEIGKVARAFAGMSRLLANIIQGGFLVFVPLVLSTELTLYFLFFIIVFMTPLYFGNILSYKFGQEATNTSNKMVSNLMEILNSFKLIQSFGLQKKAIFDYEKSIVAHAKAHIKYFTFNRGIYLIFVPLGTIASLITLYIADSNEMKLSEMAMIFFAFSRILPILAAILQERNALEGFIPAYEQVESLKNQASNYIENKKGLKFTYFKDKISINNLNFNYPTRKTTLTNINLELKKGQITSFVGKSGSGKTTLIDIIIGLFDPSDGQIKIDNVDLKNYQIDSFRKKIGYVPQETFLFNMTLRENILWSNPDLNDEEIWELCKLSNSYNFIYNLPNKLDTEIGDSGLKLSGGQRQRISLTRAIAKKPEILILDEATSNLDSESENLIQESILKLSNSMTILIIAHRISTIKISDQIYVLDKGQLVEKGNYNNLVQNKNSKFYKIFYEQIL